MIHDLCYVTGMMNKYYLCTMILATVTITLGIVLF